MQAVETSFLNPATLGFLLALGVQVVSFIVWAAKTASAVSNLSTRIGAVENEQRSQDKSMSDMKTTMARMDERTKAIADGMSRVEKRLDNIGPKA